MKRARRINTLYRMVAVDYRAPVNKEETKLCGQTVVGEAGEVAKVFINNRRKRTNEALNTFFHEMTHVYLAMFAGRRLDAGSEETLANQVGNVVEELFKAK